MNSSESTRVVRNDQLPTNEIDGELVALDLEQGDCFGINRVGAAIWHAAEHPRTVGEIADGLVATHAVERERCLSDLLPFIDDMIEAGLLHRVD